MLQRKALTSTIISSQAELTQVLWMGCTPVLKLSGDTKPNLMATKMVQRRCIMKHSLPQSCPAKQNKPKCSGWLALLCWSWMTVKMVQRGAYWITHLHIQPRRMYPSARQRWPAKFWWWQKQFKGGDMEAHIYRRLSSYAALWYLLQLASTPGIHVQTWLMTMTKSVGQPEGVQSRSVCTSGFSETSIEMHLKVQLSKEQLGCTSSDFSQGAEWRLEKDRRQNWGQNCFTDLYSGYAYTISRKDLQSLWSFDGEVQCYVFQAY